MSENTFQYTYSATVNQEVMNIRPKYMPHEETKLSILLSIMVGMFLFMMIPILTPLDATAIHALGCLAGGVLLGVGFGAISNQMLKKTSLV